VSAILAGEEHARPEGLGLPRWELIEPQRRAGIRPRPDFGDDFSRPRTSNRRLFL
jgi:hypothetical protein